MVDLFCYVVCISNNTWTFGEECWLEWNVGLKGIRTCAPTACTVLGFNALVQSAGFSVKPWSLGSNKPRLVTSYILSRLDYCNCLLVGKLNSVIQPNQNAKRSLQDSFSRYPATATQYLSWKNCTGFPFRNVFSRLYMFQCYKLFWSCLPLNCYMSRLRLVHYALLLTPACWKFNTTQDSWLPHFLLPWTQRLEIISTRP